MSDEFLPAWVGDNAIDKPFNSPVPINLKLKLEEALSQSFGYEQARVLSKLNETNSERGHYLVEINRKNNEKIVMHVKERSGAEHLIFAEEVTSSCKQACLNVPTHIFSKEQRIEESWEEFFINCTEYIDGTAVPRTTFHINKLGSALGLLHNHLSSKTHFEHKAELATAKRSSRLQRYINEANKNLLEYRHCHRTLLEEALGNFDILAFETDPIICHGDLNPGNILFSSHNQIFFIDFNDSLFSFKNPLFDVASCVLRHCWQGNSISKLLMECFINNYCEVTGCVFDDEQVKTAMMQVIYQNVIVVSNYKIGSLISNQEFEKFEHLKFRATSVHA